MSRSIILALLAYQVSAQSTCARGGECFLLELQEQTCCGESGFTIHGLWART